MEQNNFFLMSIFPILFLACCSPPKRQQPCELHVKGFSFTGNELKIVTESTEGCTGTTIELDHGNGRFYFFVNFTSGILKNAPPFGFSQKSPLDSNYVSLGVEKNIRKISGTPIALTENTSIESLESRGKTKVKWSFRAENGKGISKITVLNDPQKAITISRLNRRDCGFIYNSIISEPRHVKRLSPPPRIFPFKKFLSFCSKKWRVNDPEKLVQEIFVVTDEDIKRLEKAGEQQLATFLKTLEKSDLKSEKHYNASGQACNILVAPVDARAHEQLTVPGFVFYAEKINEESFQQKFEGPVIEVATGSYIIKAIGDRYHGRSTLVNCHGGDNITLAIPVMPNI